MSKIKYETIYKKITVICRLHGEFDITARDFMRGNGCKKCGYAHLSNIKKDSINDVLRKFKKIHGNRYDYSWFKDFKTDLDKIKIICKKHGEFFQSISSHKRGSGCPRCSNKNLSREELIELLNKKYNNFYDYTKAIFKKYNDDITIVCPIHGEFKEKLNYHRQGKGYCKKCIKEKGKIKRLNEFIKRSNLIFGNRYDYSKTFINNTLREKVIIICKKHGEFIKRADAHLEGKGCQKCWKQNSKNIIFCENFLNNNMIFFDREAKFKGLKYKKDLSVDFSLMPNLPIIIEIDGPHHFMPVIWFNQTNEQSIKEYQEQKKRDRMKNKYFIENKIWIIRISYKKKQEEIENILEYEILQGNYKTKKFLIKY